MQSSELGMTVRAVNHRRPRLLGPALTEHATEGIKEHLDASSPAREERAEARSRMTVRRSRMVTTRACCWSPSRRPSEVSGNASPLLRQLAGGAEHFLAGADLDNKPAPPSAHVLLPELVLPALDVRPIRRTGSTDSTPWILSNWFQPRTLLSQTCAYWLYPTAIQEGLQRSRGISRLGEAIPSDRAFSLCYEAEGTGQPKKIRGS